MYYISCLLRSSQRSPDFRSLLSAGNMDNPEEVLHCLDEFAKLKPKNIPRELEDYLTYVARTGDPVYQWPTVKILFREKLLNVITEFYESTPTHDLTASPNVDPFNYETMKAVLLDRLEAFSNAPFTVQRLCELLTTPRKEYNRADKFMRAIEKNILVVSTREPGGGCRPDSALSEPIPNGVSETPEAASNQSSSGSSSSIVGSSEERPAQTSSLDILKDSEGKSENHVVSELVLTEAPNHVNAELPETSSNVDTSIEGEESKEGERGKEDEVSKEEEPSKEDEASGSMVDNRENMVVTELSDSSTCDNVRSVTVASEDINVSSSECNLDTYGGSSVEQPTECAAEIKEGESVPTSSSSSEVTSVGDAVLDVVQENNTIGQIKPEVVSETDSIIESKKSEDASADALSDADQAVSEAITEPSKSPEKSGNPREDSENSFSPQESTICEPTVSSAQDELPVDSTASATEDTDTTTLLDASSSVSPVEISTSTVSETKAEERDSKIDTADSVEGSEATPAVEKAESEVKEIVEAAKGDADASISSTGVTESVQGNEEDMEVDESSNQASAADNEAMEVADDDEPMEVCEDTLEEMTTSPQETTQ